LPSNVSAGSARDYLNAPKNAWAERSVAEYLKDGWDIKAITQISPIGYTQVVMQRGLMGVICTTYYSVKDNGWTAVGGCTPVPWAPVREWWRQQLAGEQEHRERDRLRAAIATTERRERADAADVARPVPRPGQKASALRAGVEELQEQLAAAVRERIGTLEREAEAGGAAAALGRGA
jgi:hypothetical protein